MEENPAEPAVVEWNSDELRDKRRFYWSWSKGQRAYARLHRECLTFEVELRYVKERLTSENEAWLRAAYRELRSANSFLKRRDVEGGWCCLHAAQRYAIYGLDKPALADKALILRGESSKLSSWRAEAIEALVKDFDQLTPGRLAEAMKLRDEHDANQYHKIWLTADQLGVVTTICAASLFLLLPLILYFHVQKSPYWDGVQPSPWGWAMVLSVLVLGVFGSSFSIVQSIITDTNAAKIPERVANHWVTIIMALFGSVAGIAGYAFLRSKIINIQMGAGGDPVAFSLAVAFLFGYSGERLIAKFADSLGTSRAKR